MSKNKIFFCLFSLFVFTISLSQFLSVRILFILLIYSLIFYSKKEFLIPLIRDSWDLLGYILILVVGLINSNDIDTGFRVLETNFSFLSIPIVLNGFRPIDNKNQQWIFYTFIIGLLVSSSTCLLYALFQFMNGASLAVFFFHSLTEVIHIQPTYYAYYLCFAITLGLYFLYYEVLNVWNWAIIIILLFFFMILMLTGGRTAYVSMIFVFSFFILKFLFENDRTFVRKIAFCISVSFLILMLVINHYDLNAPSLRAESDYWERLSLWRSAINASSNFFFGVGTGDYKMVMNEYYRTHNLSQFAPDSFNAHNQFLQTFFSNGLIGVIAVVMLIARPLYLSVKYQNVLGTLVFFSFIIYGMTEVFLGRYQGVVFFAFLHQIFVHFYYSRRSSFSLKGI